MILSRDKFTNIERGIVDDLMDSCNVDDLNQEVLRRSIENLGTKKTTTASAETEQNLDLLPLLDDKLRFGPWDSFPMARPVIKSEHKYAVTWHGGLYIKKGKGRQCPGLDHLDTKAINHRSLCLVAEYVRLVKKGTIIRGKRERRYFCLKRKCVMNFSPDYSTFTNICPPSIIDVSLCNDEQKRHNSIELSEVRLV